MKISAINKTQPALAAACLQIVEPGLTIGSCPDADMTLVGAQNDVGRIQAIVRIEDDGYSVENMSATGCVVLNGKSMKLRQIVPLQPGDQLDVGGFGLSLEDETSRHAPCASPPQDPGTNSLPRPNPISNSFPTTTDDIFTSLLDGPGVIPVGASAPTLHRDDTPDDILTDPRPTILDRGDAFRGSRRDDISEVLDRAIDPERNRDQQNS